jgi:hypothetical protein
MPTVSNEEIENRFSYHSPKGDQPQRYENIRAHAKALAEVIVNFTPESREQALALTHLDSVVMFANASIARRE